jgi:hypothetical protein
MGNGNATTSTQVLKLTPERTRLARDVVTAFDGLDWQQIKDANCEVVHVRFQNRESLNLATDLLMQLAANDPELALRAQEKLEIAVYRLSALRVASNSPPPAQARLKEPVSEGSAVTSNSGTSGDTEAELVLRQIKSFNADKPLRIPLVNQPSEFFKLWKEVNGLVQRLQMLEAQGVRFIREQGGGGEPPQSPQNLGVVGLGPVSVSDLWLSVPLDLLIARPIVGLGRRIASSNTGIGELLINPGEELAARLHSELLVRCQPEAYQIAADESDPTAGELQRKLDRLFELCREFINQVFSRGAEAEQPAASAPTATDRTTGSSVRPPKGHPLDERVDKTKVPIRITADFVAEVNGKEPGGEILPMALLTLSGLAGNGATEYVVEPREFIQLAYRTKKEVPKKWGANRKALQSKGVHVGKPINGTYKLSGFKVQLDPGLSQEKVLNYLKSLPPRER